MRGINNFASNILCSVVMESFQAKKKTYSNTQVFNYKTLLASCWAIWSICHSGFCYMVEMVCAVYRTEVCSLNLNTISLTKLIRGLANHTLHTWGRWRWSKVIVMVTFLQIHKDRHRVIISVTLELDKTKCMDIHYVNKTLILTKAGCTLDNFQILPDFKTMGDHRHEDSSTDF